MMIRLAFFILKNALKDKGYKQSWVANIAMAYVDAETQYGKRSKYLNRKDKYAIANMAAENFVNNFFNTI